MIKTPHFQMIKRPNLQMINKPKFQMIKTRSFQTANIFIIGQFSRPSRSALNQKPGKLPRENLCHFSVFFENDIIFPYSF